jgi:GAF domain-containing protein
MREGTPIGVIILQRRAVRPFTNKQIELAETFADQAVIAIENVRLFDEVQTRTKELTVALEHQTATSEILSSISGSITDAQPVFEAIARNLRRLFGTRFAVVQLLHDGMVHVVSRQVMKRNPKPGGGTIRARWGTTLQAASPCCRSRSSSLHRRLQTQRRRR